MTFEHDVLCAFCRENLQGAERVAENFVYKLGELAYIELAHAECAEREQAADACWCGVRDGSAHTGGIVGHFA